MPSRFLDNVDWLNVTIKLCPYTDKVVLEDASKKADAAKYADYVAANAEFALRALWQKKSVEVFGELVYTVHVDGESGENGFFSKQCALEFVDALGCYDKKVVISVQDRNHTVIESYAYEHYRGSWQWSAQIDRQVVVDQNCYDY